MSDKKTDAMPVAPARGISSARLFFIGMSAAVVLYMVWGLARLLGLKP